VIALTNDNKVILAKQFRPGPEIIMFELPGGGIGRGEAFEAGIARELEEETGYTPGRIEHLGDVYKDAYTNTQWHYFIAYDCEPLAGGQSLDSTEFIEVVKVSIEELFELSRSAKMTDSEAVLLAYETLKKIGES
jgi:ADP-ribose pyrophosphatase